MFSIYDNLTGTRLSNASYHTVEEANRDYHMNEGHTHVGDIGMKRAEEIARAGRCAAEIAAEGDTELLAVSSYAAANR